MISKISHSNSNSNIEFPLHISKHIGFDHLASYLSFFMVSVDYFLGCDNEGSRGKMTNLVSNILLISLLPYLTWGGHFVSPYFFIANNFLLRAATVMHLFYFSFQSTLCILINFHRGSMHTLENIGF